MTGAGTGPTIPRPHQPKLSLKPLIGPPLPMIRANPRKTVIPPSVTTNEGTERRETMSPCSRPDKPPAAIAASAAQGHAAPPHGRTNRVSIAPFATTAATSPVNAASAPTERSIPRVRITKVMPTPRMP